MDPLPAPLAAHEQQPALSLAKRLFVMPAFLSALKSGEEIVNAARVKNVQGIASALSALLIAIAAIGRAYGYTLPISDDQLGQLAVLCATLLLNAWATFATSKRVGVGVSNASDGGNDQATERGVPDPASGSGWPAGINDGRGG